MLRHLLALQPMEQDDLVDAVQELGAEMRAHDGHHLVAHGVAVLALRLVHEIFGAEIGGHDDERVAEIDGAALAVGEPAVVEHLEQHVEHVGVRLLDLVEQDDLIGPPAHGLGQRAALFIADIAGRRADQPGDGVLLHVFAHVDADHGVLVVEQEFGERAWRARSCRRRSGPGT